MIEAHGDSRKVGNLESSPLQKKLILAMIVIFFLSGTISALEYHLSIPLGVSAKSDIMFKQLYGERNTFYGAGAAVFFSDSWGAYLDTHIMNTDGVSNFYKQTVTYGETSVGLGMVYRFKIWEPTPSSRLNIYLKGGVQFIRYSEEIFEKTSRNLFGFSIGGGVIFWTKQFGIGLELKKEMAEQKIDIRGTGTNESISFNSSKLSLNAAVRF